MNTTIKELADIGAKAALAEMKKHEDFSTSLFLSPRYCKKHYQSDRPAREAFAAAVAEKVREEYAATPKEGGVIYEKDMPAALTQLAQEVATLRAEIARKDEEIAQQTKEYGALVVKHAETQAELARYKPRPVSVKPTKADASETGKVTLIGPAGVLGQVRWTPWDEIHESWSHWLPGNLAAYGLELTPEEQSRAEFEVFYKDYNVTKDPKGFAFDVWQAARAGKGVEL